MVHHSIFAVRAGVSPVKPLSDAGIVKAMQTWQDHKLFLKFIVAHADCAMLILFCKVFIVGFGESRYWKVVHIALRDRLDYVVIKI